MVRKGNVEVNIGANPASGEGEANEDDTPAAPVDDDSYEVIDVVDAFGLQNMGFDKKGYMGYIKDYMKAIKKRLEAQGSPRLAVFEQNAVGYVKSILENFSKYDFYVGENMDAEAMVILLETADDGKTYMIYWKDGMKGQKY